LQCLHGKIGQSLLHCIVHHVCPGIHNNADSSAAMYIGNHTAFLFHDLLESSDIQILANHRNLVNQRFLHRLGRILIPALRKQGVNVRRIAVYGLLRYR